MSTNPLSATGGPMPRVTIPLEARVAEHGVGLDILWLTFDLKLGNTFVGQGQLGPITGLSTHERYISATATCPGESLPYILDPSPAPGRLTLELLFSGLLRYQHSYDQEHTRPQGLGDAGVWHMQSIGDQSVNCLEIQVARSDWYEQVVRRLGIGDSLVTSLHLPHDAPAWKSALDHLDDAARAVTQADPPAVFGHCRAALDALPGAKTNIFDAMPEGEKRDANDDLTRSIGKYLHSGRHVVPNTASEMAGEFPVNQRDAVFVYNMTKLTLSQIYSLVHES